MFCSQCGQSVLQGSKFCSSCGFQTVPTSGETPIDRGQVDLPPAVRSLLLAAEAGEKDAIRDLACWYRDSGDLESASHWFTELSRLSGKGRFDFSAVAKAIVNRNPSIQVAMYDDAAPGGLRLGEIDDQLLLLVRPDRSGLSRILAGVYVKRVNEEVSWVTIDGDLGELSFEGVLLDAKVSPVTSFGYTCEQFGQRGRFRIATPIDYCTPEFAADLALSLAQDVSNYVPDMAEILQPNLARPEVVNSTQGELERIHRWLEETGRSDFFSHRNESAFLVSCPVPGLSLFTFEFEGDNGELTATLGEKVYGLAENVPFHDSGLGLAVDYKNFSLGLQIALPLEFATVEVLSKQVRFLELAKQVIAGDN